MVAPVVLGSYWELPSASQWNRLELMTEGLTEKILQIKGFEIK
jgi:hypothetical protein